MGNVPRTIFNIGKKVDRKKRASITKENFEELFLKGVVSNSQIAKLFNVSRQTIMRCRKKSGSMSFFKMLQERNKKILDLYELGTKPSIIASKLNLSKGRVFQILKKVNDGS